MIKEVVRYVIWTILGVPCLAIVVIIGFLLTTLIPKRDVAPGVSSAHIIQLHAGMHVGEVLAILGPPLECYDRGEGRAQYEAEESKWSKTTSITPQTRPKLLVYAREVDNHASSTLNLYFDENYKLYGVYASDSDGYDVKHPVYNMYAGYVSDVDYEAMKALFD